MVHIEERRGSLIRGHAWDLEIRFLVRFSAVLLTLYDGCVPLHEVHNKPSQVQETLFCSLYGEMTT